jgi:hypothetical protein
MRNGSCHDGGRVQTTGVHLARSRHVSQTRRQHANVAECTTHAHGKERGSKGRYVNTHVQCMYIRWFV